MTAGYSKTPLVKKLGFKSGFKAIILNPIANYAAILGELPENVTMVATLENNLDLIQFFTRSQAELTQEFPKLKQALTAKGMVWISWPKKASKMETDLNETIIREIGLNNGLVDVKVCAVDENWSGLKFVYRVKDRW